MNDAVVLLAIVSLLVVITFVWELRTPEARKRAQWTRRTRRDRDLRDPRTDYYDR